MHDPTEHVQEHITHEAAHGHGDHGDHGPKWIIAAALTAAILAAFAAVCGALATSYLTESTLSRIASNDTWNEYGQKSIKNSNIDTRNFEYTLAKWASTLPLASGSKIPDGVEKLHQNDLSKKAEYNGTEAADSLPNLKERADKEKELSERNLDAHETYEFAATMFHISIAVVAIAVVAKRKEFWYLSMACGVVGVILFSYAILISPAKPRKGTEAAAEAPVHASDKGAAATAPATGAATKGAAGESGDHAGAH